MFLLMGLRVLLFFLSIILIILCMFIFKFVYLFKNELIKMLMLNLDSI